ncbi:MAG: hypothetical protein HY721_30320, partial [Planctomycetes bacterium]|nr:hypothetical protein [Planctomycetota bacterium]
YRAGAVSLSAVAALSVHPGAQLFFGDLSEVAGEDALRAAAGKAGGLGAAGGGGGPSLVWIDGHDHDGAGVVLDGEVSVYGIATEPAESPGENGAQIVLQVPPECQPRIQGTGGPPSVGESSGAGSSGTFEQLKASATQRLAPGRHSGLTLGLDGREEYPVVYGEGDLELSGTNAGRGALVVEGSLTVTGSFAFQGLVVVKGDVTLDGGAGGVEILGALMTDGTLVAIGGSTRLLYSSGTLASLQQAITRGRSYEGIYYDER